MMGYCLILLSSLVSGTGGVFQKLWQKKTLTAENAPYIFMLLNSVFACVIFFLTAGCNVAVNKVTMLYSAAYGFLCCLTLLLGFVTMSRMNLIVCSVFSKGTSAAVWIVGILFFRESITPSGVISAILMLISVLMPFFEVKKGKIGLKGVLAGLGVIAVGTMSTTLLKLYSAEAAKMSDSVMCFYTNVFMLVFQLIRFAALPDKGSFFTEFKASGKWLLCVPACTLGSNLSSLISMSAIKLMPLSLYSVVGQAIGCVVVFIQSKIIFKEQCSRSDIVSFALSAAAVMITLI